MSPLILLPVPGGWEGGGGGGGGGGFNKLVWHPTGNYNFVNLKWNKESHIVYIDHSPLLDLLALLLGDG